MDDKYTDRANEEKESLTDVRAGQSHPMLPQEHEIPSVAETTGEEHASCDTDGVPYDRGWAWMVVAGNLINYILLAGYIKTSGVFFVELLRHFQAPASKTALLFGIRGGVYSVSGLFVMNAVVGRLGCRKTAVIGATLMFLSAVLSSLANELTLLICLQAVLLGMADSMLTAPGEVLTARYCKRRRSLALAVEKLGAAIGSMVYPPLLALLLSRYGLRGALLLTGAISLHALPASLLFRPLSFYRSSGSGPRDDGKAGGERAASGVKSAPSHRSSASEDGAGRRKREAVCDQVREAEVKFDVSRRSSCKDEAGQREREAIWDQVIDCYEREAIWDQVIDCYEREATADPKTKSATSRRFSCKGEASQCEREAVSDLDADHREREETAMDASARRCKREITTRHSGSRTHREKETTSRHSNIELSTGHCDAGRPQEGLQRWGSASGRLEVSTERGHHDSQRTTGATRQTGENGTRDCLKGGQRNGESPVAYSVEEDHSKMRSSSSSALFRPETEKRKHNSLLRTSTKTDSNDLEQITGTASFLRKFQSAVSVLDFSLFRRKSFRVFFVYYMFAPTINVSLDYLPALAQQNGLSKTQAAQLLSLAGGVDLGGRLVSGLLVGAGVVSPPAMVAASLAALGAVYQSVGLLTSFPLMAALSATHGAMSGVVNCMQVVIIVHVAGMPDMAQGISFQTMAEGAFLAGFHPLCGYIRDVTGSYNAVYHVIGCALLMAAALLVATELLKRREQRQGREHEYELSLNVDPV